MAGIIVIGTNGETGPFQAAGLRCFEPEAGRLVERVLAERARCNVLALTQTAHAALPGALARNLRQGAWPRLVVLPHAADAGAVPRLREALQVAETAFWPRAA